MANVVALESNQKLEITQLLKSRDHLSLLRVIVKPGSVAIHLAREAYDVGFAGGSV